MLDGFQEMAKVLDQEFPFSRSKINNTVDDWETMNRKEIRRSLKGTYIMYMVLKLMLKLRDMWRQRNK